jgi:hypothetical protein
MWQTDFSQHLSGSLVRTTLELPESISAEEGFNYYKKQLEKFNLRELFFCRARDCGASNTWANIHFKVIQLYGLDQHQFYGAYEVTTAEEKPFYVVIYAVVRGNKRAYLQLEILTADSVSAQGVASNPETLNKILNTNGYYVFPDLMTRSDQKNTSIQLKANHLQALVNLLAQQPQLNIALVGHSYSQTSVEQQLQESKANAEKIKSALVAAGVMEKRLHAYGVGSLAPAGRGDYVLRVEVVKLSGQ